VPQERLAKISHLVHRVVTGQVVPINPLQLCLRPLLADALRPKELLHKAHLQRSENYDGKRLWHQVQPFATLILSRSPATRHCTWPYTLGPTELSREDHT
jgi:hypothetical protein